MATPKSKLFSRKFRNWLLHLVVSRQDLKSITGYTLQALAQDGKQWQDKLAILQPLYDGFDAGLTTQGGASAGRSAQTLLAETAYTLVKQFMKRAYKVNFAALEETAPDTFKLFFPQGRSQFSNATRQTMATIFGTFVQTLTDKKNLAQVPGGAALLADAQSLQGQYTTARQEQDKRKKQVKTSGTDLDADETDLLTELFGVYAALLAFYYKTPEKAETYFDFSVLPRSQRQPEADAAPGTSAPA